MLKGGLIIYFSGRLVISQRIMRSYVLMEAAADVKCFMLKNNVHYVNSMPFPVKAINVQNH